VTLNIPQTVDIYSGAFPYLLTGHLAVGILPTPITITTITEASWKGYSAIGVSVQGRETDPSGFAFLFVGVTFGNNSGVEQMPTAIYLTCVASSVTIIVAVIPLPSDGQQVVPVGGVTWQLQLSSFEGT
jgi:hypothetical protein